MEQFLDYFIPEKYDLSLSIDKRDETLSGQLTITGHPNPNSPEPVIKLHATDMDLIKVCYNNYFTDICFLGTNPAEIAHHASYEDDVLTIYNINPDPKTPVEIFIVFNRKLNHNMQGAYLSTYQHQGKTETIVATQFESHYARECFPCIDEPSAKAVFNLKITDYDPDDTVLSGMPIVDVSWQDQVGNVHTDQKSIDRKTFSSRTTIFAPSPRMSTYLLAFVVGKFHSKTITNRHGTKITTYAPLNQPIDSVDFANHIASRALEFYDHEFGLPYPLPKLDQVALPDFEAGAMENWGLVTYRESMLLADQTASLPTKKSIALTVAHELSHQWFGDLVTMQWWDELWLNESFASIMEYFAVDAIHPEFKIWENFFTGDCLVALKRDAYKDVQPIHQDVNHPAEIATLFDSAIVYSKGARLMLMLIRLMGWNNFKQGIKDYFKKYQYQNTIGDHLWNCLRPYADFDPKAFMHAWITQPGFPVISEDQSMKRFLLDSSLKPASWPLPQLEQDMSGHYILNLKETTFAQQLASFNRLGMEEKLRLLIDRSLIVKTDLAPSASLLDLLPHFKTEDSPAIWTIIASVISDLKVFFKPDSPAETVFKNFVFSLIETKLAEIGLKTHPQDDEDRLSLRSILLALNFYAENPANLSKLASFYRNDIARLDPETRADILDAKIHTDPKIFSTYLEKYQTVADPELKLDLISAMALSKDRDNLRNLIKLLKKPDILKPQDHLHLFLFLYRNPKSRNQTFTWLTKNWDYVVSFAGDKSLDSYPRYIANSIRTPKEATAFFDFFQSKRRQPALARTLKIAQSEIHARLRLITTDTPSLHQKLRNLYPN